MPREGEQIERPGKGRLLLFAFGDFAFNLYWQSVMLFLLFYYTDGIDLPIAVAATIYTVASIWDGIANFAAGLFVERRQTKMRFGTLIAAGGVPLGLSFILMYLPPLAGGTLAIVTVFAGHILFRTVYAAVNVPYLAMTARISPDAGDRAFVAGIRMLFGTAAAIVVALATVPLGGLLTASADLERSFFASAIFFGVIGAIILAIVGATYREHVLVDRKPPQSISGALVSLARNRAFVALNAAAMAMIVALTVLNKSVLYYFKYMLGDADAGQVALALMGLVSALAIPLWMLLGRVVGLRALWLIAASVGMLGLGAFAGVDIGSVRGMQLFLIGMQVISVGLNFVFWAMLPNTIEYGESETGVHVEGAVFGVAALLQRIAIGIATGILGWGFASAGYVANVAQSASTIAGMRATIALVPLLFLAISCAAMLLNPLGRGTHRRIVRKLSAERARTA